MKTNVQITAVQKEFKNGQNGYEVKVEGMDGKLNCKMNFYEPLKAMRYMFMLSKRLELQIDSVQLAALSLAYQRAKEAEEKAVEDAMAVDGEFTDANAVSINQSFLKYYDVTAYEDDIMLSYVASEHSGFTLDDTTDFHIEEEYAKNAIKDSQPMKR